MGEKMSVVELIKYFSLYLRSAMVRFPLCTSWLPLVITLRLCELSEHARQQRPGTGPFKSIVFSRLVPLYSVVVKWYSNAVLLCSNVVQWYNDALQWYSSSVQWDSCLMKFEMNNSKTETIFSLFMRWCSAGVQNRDAKLWCSTKNFYSDAIQCIT